MSAQLSSIEAPSAGSVAGGATAAAPGFGPWQQLRTQWQAQPRVRLGVALIVLIIWAYGVLEASDRLQRSERRLAQLQAELRAARTQDTDASRWALRASDAASRLQALERELWINGSEAAAQARLRDWLLEIARSQQAGRYLVTLGNPTAVRSAASAPATSADGGAAPLRLLKASLSFDFTPATLESVLQAIESGNRFAQIETLSVNKRARRVEMNVAVAARIETEAQAPAELGAPASAPAAGRPLGGGRP